MPEQTRRTLPYGVLCLESPEVDEKLRLKIDDLYEGGERIQKRARDYLPQIAWEHSRAYDSRVDGAAAYLPYFSQIVDQFASDLFGQPLTVSAAPDAEDPDSPGKLPDEEFYSALSDDLDLKGTPLVEAMRREITTALKHQVAYLMVDAPVDSAKPAVNRAEEEARGTRRCYAYEVPPEQVLDWELDEFGKFSWVVLHKSERRRASISATRKAVAETWDVWERGDAGGKARWARFRLEWTPETAPTADTPVPAVDGGESSFPDIPLLRLALPAGLWVGNKIAGPIVEHWRRRSALVGAENRSCVAIPFVTLGSEMGSGPEEIPAERGQDPARGDDPYKKFSRDGFMVGGKDDKLTFAEPDGRAYHVIDQQITALKDEIFRVCHQMAASVTPTAGALGRSGLSKQKDGESTAKVLGALGQIVRQFTRELYDLVAKARAEDVVWAVHGLDSYQTDDREQVIEEALALDQVAIPSKTFRVEHAVRVAQKVIPGMPPDTIATIRKEIVEGAEQEKQVEDVEREAHVDDVLNPAPPVVVAPPNGSPPKPKEPKPAKPVETKGS